MTEPTPYDTGEVLEPFSWSQRAEAGFLDDLEPCDFGKVDFDDDEGTTRATVTSVRIDDGNYTLIVVDHVTGIVHGVRLGVVADGAERYWEEMPRG